MKSYLLMQLLITNYSFSCMYRKCSRINKKLICKPIILIRQCRLNTVSVYLRY